jgi:hypothetical protein
MQTLVVILLVLVIPTFILFASALRELARKAIFEPKLSEPPDYTWSLYVVEGAKPVDCPGPVPPPQQMCCQTCAKSASSTGSTTRAGKR